MTLREISPSSASSAKSLVLLEIARTGRTFAQLSNQREFHSLRHCVIPTVRQFPVLNLISLNFI